MDVECPVLDEGNRLPSKYTCKGEGASPPLLIKDVPNKTKSLLIVMFDPDAPLRTFIHWILYNIPPDINAIEENESRFTCGRNSLFLARYFPPCPPCGKHRYIFKVYATDLEPNLKKGLTYRKIRKIIKNHIIDETEIVTLFGKNKGKKTKIK